jgi:hypothetical protein
MSRAFVKEDAGGPERRFALPDPDDPGYDAAAALALLEAAKEGETRSAEDATGYRWGAPELRPHVERLLEKERELPDETRDRRFMMVAKRYLHAASE